MDFLSDRQKSILNYAVDAHIEWAQPVGSQHLLQNYGLDYSSATIRHEMGELEQLGYLEQPHVSAGRVPTDRGYRFYVENGLKRPESSSPEVTERILERYSGLSDSPEPDQFAESAAGFIASLLRETGVIVLIEHDPVTRRERRRRLFVQGVSHILEKPEFQNISKAKPLFRTLEEKQRLIEMLYARGETSEPEVTIGHENALEPLFECSVVKSSYVSGVFYSGTIAVIGPRRMRYGRVLPLVERMTRVLKQALCEKESIE